MEPQIRFFELWLGTMNDVAKISFEQGLRLQARQLELLMAMQTQIWTRFWVNALTRPAGPGARGGPWPT